MNEIDEKYLIEIDWNLVSVLMKPKKWKWSDLAKAAGVSPSTISESRKLGRIAILPHVARALDYPAKSLLK